ncbi:DNA polymerase I protein [Rhizobium phage RHph_X2_28B]|uniref:DNA polymerase I protein n=1 Tax=Rhizobium phage RHph_X2_28B TaxID=2836086 RepID=UPI0023297960|nr:DNA polymerase I protein [Rhizobium phage RHph_X2_28B]QWY83509.1 DNA polymerase I protein [Rhizobium phage RHph_X2_28B]QWY83745.1 DNA polymerase I protein [Rhizobium phage RHph_X3_15]
MKYHTYSAQELSEYPITFLVQNIKADEIKKVYLDPHGINPDQVLVLDLHYSQEKKKTPVAEMKAYITEELVSVLTDMKTEYIVVNDSEYFKVLTKSLKTEANLGYVLDCAFGPWKVVYVPTFKAIFYDPEKVIAKITQGMTALNLYRSACYIDPGKHIIKEAHYLDSFTDIAQWLDKLLSYDALTCDIEGFSLKHYDAGIGTITFCWEEGKGIAFPVDYRELKDATEAPYGVNHRNDPLRKLLRRFFERFQGKMIYHNISFDVYVLIYQLFMKDLLDTEGLLYGMEVLLRNWECTKLISYLATNSCAGNKLSLKDQAQEYAGNYAVEEINDITKIPLPKLLQYNLVDGISTWYVFNKNYPKMVADQQLDIYETIFKPAILDIVQMQLTGMPLDMKRVHEVKVILEKDRDSAIQRMQSSSIIQKFNYSQIERYVDKKNQEWKVKRTTVSEVEEQAKTNPKLLKEIVFNPNSGPQLQRLLYEKLGLPVIDLTDNKNPATGADTLKSLKNHTESQEVKDLLDALVDFNAVDIILGTFISAFLEAKQGPDGWYYLFGSFNLGGTVSGRLSSNNPNLQNLPATGSKYAKLIKTCFKAPPGWLFCGLDFASLEDRISALTTKDPQKLKVYTDGYDGHSLRAYAYFGDHMLDIDPDSVESINSIQTKYKDYRQESKAPTFALTYQGTFKTLMNNCGFSDKKARDVELKYHILYKVSDDWVAAKLDQACVDGYVTVAFGLRVRTPLLAQVVRGTSKTPFEAEAEGRTAGNALGQSWCLLNSRASSEFMGKVRKSEFRLSIRPCAQIHDASYYMVRDEMRPLMYMNDNLVKAVQWQNHPDIWHDEVKLGGEVSIFYPDWSKECIIPNGASEQQILSVISKHQESLAA